jgi:homospermidine synthase
VLREIIFHSEKLKKDGWPLAKRNSRSNLAANPSVKPVGIVTRTTGRAPSESYKAMFWNTWHTMRGLSVEAVQAKWDEYCEEFARG